MLTIDDLFSPPTADQVLETYLSALETLGIPARSWRKGGAFRNILRVVAVTFAGFAVVMSQFAKSGFLDSASGGWLTLLAWFLYGVRRDTATFATGYVLFTNVGGGVHTDAAGTVFVLKGTKGYRTLDDLALLNPGDTQLVAVEAREIGAGSNAAPTLINALETTLLGVTVSNPESVVGRDEQTDENLRQTCRDKIAALSLLGPRGAYDYAVTVAKRIDGSPVDINRRQTSANDTTGVLTLYCASPSGTPVAGDLTAVRASVETYARPDTVTAVVVGATPVAFSKSLTVWAKSTPGLDAPTVQAAVLASLIALVSEYPIGGLKKPPSIQGYLFATNIEGTAKSAHPAIFAVDGVGSDLAINTGEVATLAATVTVRLV